MAEEESEYEFSYNADLLTYSDEIKEKLSDIFLDGLIEMSEIKEIDGITLIKYDGKQPLLFSMNVEYYKYLEGMGETIASLEPEEYFKDLSNKFEYRGDGHIDLEDFDLFLAKLDDDLLIGVLSSDTSANLFDVSQKFADKILNVIHATSEENKETADDDLETFTSSDPLANEPKKEKKSKNKSKADLMMDLRGRLDQLKD